MEFMKRWKKCLIAIVTFAFLMLGAQTVMAANNTAAYQKLKNYIISNGSYTNGAYVKLFSYEGDTYNFFYKNGIVELRAGEYNRTICLDDEGTDIKEGQYSLHDLDLGNSLTPGQGLTFVTNIKQYSIGNPASFVASDGSVISNSMNTLLNSFLSSDVFALEYLMLINVGADCSWTDLGYPNIHASSGSDTNNGTTMSDAVNIAFGRAYTKSWTTSTDHLNHFCKISVPQRGVITINATKPRDSEGEYGRMMFTLYSEDGDPIWGNETRTAKDMASGSYIMNIGLNTGVYYLTIKPIFLVRSGSITTNYSVSFNANEYCEIEPNDSISQGTMMKLGSVYTGYYGKDGSDYEENDYWRVQLNANTTYKVAVGNYSTINNTTTLVYVYDPYGSRTSIRWKLNQAADSNGMNYCLFTSGTAGLYSICFDNYSKNQYKYSLSISEYEKMSQQISGVETTISKSINDYSFMLNPTAETKLSYTSSNASVATVSSYGWVSIKGIGTTDITIEAEETDVYKAATIRIHLIVNDGSNPGSQTPITSPAKMKEPITINKVPSSVKAKAKKNKVTVSWKKIKKNKSGKKLLKQIKSIQVQYSTDPKFEQNINTKNVGKKKTKVKLKLQKKTTYYIRVRYVGNDGVSRWSKVKRVRTK